MKKTKEFNVVIEKGQDGYLVSDVVELPGCHTQAKTMPELLKRTKEVIQLCLKEQDKDEMLSEFITLKKIKVEA